MNRMYAARGALVAAAMITLAAAPAVAQEPGARHVRLAAHGVGLWTRLDPALAGESRSEVYFSQPMVMAHAMALDGRLGAVATVNLEGLTLRRGELAGGNAGEGYVDRRHPHTYVHEAMLVGTLPVRSFQASVALGRGFAPFGTDDPMVRGFAKYPANHHLSQILERLVAIAAFRRGGVTVEAGIFNGDEPTGPDDLGRLARFGDSWSVRATVLPVEWLELQASRAWVESPEHVFGGGLDQRKWSGSARVESPGAEGARVSGLVEWARTEEFSRGLHAFTFETFLAEGTGRLGEWGAGVRFERTTRPEEERLADAFRSARPHSDENIVGITRWTSVTGRIGRAFVDDDWSVEPFVEITRHAVRSTAGILFDPAEHYGDDRIWSVSLGARVGLGVLHTRMGRYGVALPPMHAHDASTPAAPNH
jgi:hypothetical protein